MKENLPPPKELVQKDIEVWDSRKYRFVDGKRRDVLVSRDVIIIKWSSVAATLLDQKPDHDVEIDVEFATRIAVQIDTKPVANVSTSVDLNVMAALEGGVYDSVSYATKNVADAVRQTFIVPVGPKLIRLRLDNNDGANAASAIGRVFVQY